MVRFIFVCMGVVALAVLSIAGQFITNGIGDAQEQVAARNEAPEDTVAAVDATPTAEDLNAIETTAGADMSADAPGNQTFGDAFTTDAPMALKDQEAPAMDAAATEPASN